MTGVIWIIVGVVLVASIIVALTHFAARAAMGSLTLPGFMVSHRKCGDCHKIGHKRDMVYQRDRYGHDWYHPECLPLLQGEKKS